MENENNKTLLAEHELQNQVNLFVNALGGDFDALMMVSLNRGMISPEQYKDAMAIKEECDDEEHDDMDDEDDLSCSFIAEEASKAQSILCEFQ